MELHVYNTKDQLIQIIDEFESLIWTDRYYTFGDFELYAPVSEKLLEVANDGSLLANPDSEHMMMLENVNITTDVENGSHITISGRSLEAILTRRVVWQQTDLCVRTPYIDEWGDEDYTEEDMNFQDAIEKLLNENVIYPENEKRRITNFVFVRSTDPAITELTVNAQVPAGTDLSDAISSLCSEKYVGYKIVRTDGGTYEFSLYFGKDHSYEQEDNPYVVFSPNYDNLINSNYNLSYEGTKNVALVVGYGEEDPVTTEVGDLEATGFDRKEMYVDATNLSFEDEDGITMTTEEYAAKVAQTGMEALDAVDISTSFEGEAHPYTTFVFGKDFFVGDVVALENEYGMGAEARITEIVFSHDSSGINAVPTFVVDKATTYSQGSTSGSIPEGGGGAMVPISDEDIYNICTL